MGASGNGKTWLATALGIEACHQFHKVKYVRLPELIDPGLFTSVLGT